jgi:hypothetical protein
VCVCEKGTDRAVDVTRLTFSIFFFSISSPSPFFCVRPPFPHGHCWREMFESRYGYHNR